MAQAPRERMPRRTYPSRTLGQTFQTGDDGSYYNLMITRTSEVLDKVCIADEEASSYSVALHREGTASNQLFDLKMGSCYGRTLWIEPSITVTVTSNLPSKHDTTTWLMAQSGVRTLCAADVDADVSSLDKPLGYLSTTKPYFCAMCYKRMRGESDALNHFRDMHGRTIFKNASSATSSTAPSSYSSSSPPSPSVGIEPSSGFDSLHVAYDDNTFALVVKPQGLPTLGEGRSLAKSAALMDSLVPSTALDALTKGRPVHRLDAPTGGLVIIAKTHSAVSTLCAALAERRVRKRYRAICVGSLAGDGIVEEPVSGKAAVTKYKVVERTSSGRYGFVTTVDLWPVTGRKHQLRRHLASLGHPILGDDRYGGPRHKVSLLSHENLCLWALEITLEHPTAATGLSLEQACAQEPLPQNWVNVSIAEPDIFQRVRNEEAEVPGPNSIAGPSTGIAATVEHNNKRARSFGPNSDQGKGSASS